MKKFSIALLLVLLAALLVPATAHAAPTATWAGILWNNYGGADLVVNGSDLEVTPIGVNYGAAHYNTPSAFRAAATPWVEVSFIDSLGGSQIQLWMEDENYITPNGGAWTQFGAWASYANYMIYWWDYDTYLSSGGTDGWGWIDTGVGRSAGEHTIKLAMRSDGTVDYWLDGSLVLSTTLITPNYFGDIYLAGRYATAVFTGYQTGTDYTPVLPVTIDIKPGSFPNSINLKSKGKVPVAILTTDDFDATTVDPTTVQLAGAAATHWAVEDVDNDGDMDLVLHFMTQELGLSAGSVEATLEGATYGGQQVTGSDSVRIVPKDKG